MPDESATRLVNHLKSPQLRHRVGILTLPTTWLRREPEVAVRLGVGYVDLRALILSRLEPGRRYLSLGWAEFVSQNLEALVGDTRPDGDCLLVANTDLVLASWGFHERCRFWEFLREGCRPRWALLLALPTTARRLIADDERTNWIRAERFAGWQTDEEESWPS